LVAVTHVKVPGRPLTFVFVGLVIWSF
jgi:hypothetical protein